MDPVFAVSLVLSSCKHKDRMFKGSVWSLGQTMVSHTMKGLILIEAMVNTQEIKTGTVHWQFLLFFHDD